MFVDACYFQDHNNGMNKNFPLHPYSNSTNQIPFPSLPIYLNNFNLSNLLFKLFNIRF